MTVRENMLPSAMVPGLITIRGKKGADKGKMMNRYPVDAKELINSGDYELVDNGAVEAARLAATPLQSGAGSNIPSDQIVAEVSGIEGRVVMADTPEEAEEIKEAGDNADNVPNDGSTLETTSGRTADMDRAAARQRQESQDARANDSEGSKAGDSKPADGSKAAQPTKVPTAEDKKPAEGAKS